MEAFSKKRIQIIRSDRGDKSAASAVEERAAAFAPESHGPSDAPAAVAALLERVLARRREAAALGSENARRSHLAKPLVTPEEALRLAQLPPGQTLALLEAAGLARALLHPGTAYRCGILNAKSGRCPENCAFCAQSKHHRTNAPEYPLVESEKLEKAALTLEREGVARFGIVLSLIHI